MTALTLFLAFALVVLTTIFLLTQGWREPNGLPGFAITAGLMLALGVVLLVSRRAVRKSREQ